MYSVAKCCLQECLLTNTFSGGYIISAIFICAEYQRLGIHWKEHRILAVSFWVKLAFIFLEGGLAIAFGVPPLSSGAPVGDAMDADIAGLQYMGR